TPALVVDLRAATPAPPADPGGHDRVAYHERTRKNADFSNVTWHPLRLTRTGSPRLGIRGRIRAGRSSPAPSLRSIPLRTRACARTRSGTRSRLRRRRPAPYMHRGPAGSTRTARTGPVRRRTTVPAPTAMQPRSRTRGRGGSRAHERSRARPAGAVRGAPSRAVG